MSWTLGAAKAAVQQKWDEVKNYLINKTNWNKSLAARLQETPISRPITNCSFSLVSVLGFTTSEDLNLYSNKSSCKSLSFCAARWSFYLKNNFLCELRMWKSTTKLLLLISVWVYLRWNEFWEKILNEKGLSDVMKP